MNTERNQLYLKIQQCQARIKSLQRMNTQLTKIIQINQISDYKQLLQKLSDQQASYSTQISQLNIKISQLNTQLSFNKSRSQVFVDQIQKRLEQSNKTIIKLQNQLAKRSKQNNQLKKQLYEHKKMIKNQEQLIDEYRKSIQQEKQIQKQISKCQIKQYQAQLKKQMDQKVEKVKNHYQKLLKRINQSKQAKQYQKQIGKLGVFLSQKKSKPNMNQSRENLNFSNCKSKTGNSNKFIHIQQKENQYDDAEQPQETKKQMVQKSNNTKYQSLESTLQSRSTFSHYRRNKNGQKTFPFNEIQNKPITQNQNQVLKCHNEQGNKLTDQSNINMQIKYVTCSVENKGLQFSPFDSFSIESKPKLEQKGKFSYFSKNNYSQNNQNNFPAFQLQHKTKMFKKRNNK